VRKVLLLLTILLILASFLTFSYVDKTLFSKKPIFLYFRIEKGASVKSIIKKLERKGIVEDALLAYVYVRFKGLSLKEGCYLLKGVYSTVDILKEFTKGTPCLVKVTIPEGTDIFGVDKLLSEKGFCNKGEVISLSKDRFFLKELQIPYLEGHIYPDTYFVNEKASCKEVIKTAVFRFKKVVGNLFSGYTPPKLVKRALKDVSKEKLIIVASIVEKETSIKEEKPLIAGVIYNRLVKKMKLQCDPTVYYAYKVAGIKKNKLHKGDTSFPSPYNTYYIKGLPPSPICNPGIESIKAAMFPKETHYLYFVAGEKGHIFSTSYNQHLKNIRKLYRDGKKIRNR